jgi:hypothetical protein
MLEWIILDKRIWYPEGHARSTIRPSLEVQGLVRKGAVSTWGIDPSLMSAWQ